MLNDQNDKNKISRRQFLGMAWGLSLAGLFGQAGVALWRYFKPQVEAGTFGSKVIAGRVDEFQPGTVSHVQAGRFYISRLEDGGFIALWHRCTHLGCTVPWREDEGRFNCPCHSSIFDTVGEVVSGPAPRPMDIFPIEVTNEEISVDTGNPIQRDKFNADQATYV
jgi:cytochrome b6-f complex iron-sulfur subunit